MRFEIESRLLRYVIAVAEEGNITRAAMRRLFIAPPSLAREIRQLEDRLGYNLFDRHWRGVSVTPAGAVFVEEARKARKHISWAAERGAAASRGDTGTLILGHTPFLDSGRLIELRRRFTEIAPAVSLVFRTSFSMPLVELVLGGVVQAGIVVLPAEDEELRSECVWKHPLVVAAPEGILPASPNPISLRDLSGSPSVWPAKSLNPGLRGWMLATCDKAGCAPRIVHEVLTCDELLDAVAAGVGIGFVKRSTAQRLQMKGVIFRDLADPGLVVRTAVVYRTDHSSSSLSALLRVLKDLADCDEASSDSSSRPLAV